MSRSCLPLLFPPCFCPWERCGQEISERAQCVTQTVPFGPVCLDGPGRLRGSRQCQDIPGTAPNQLWLRFLRASASALHSSGLQRGHVRDFCKNYSGIVKPNCQTPDSGLTWTCGSLLMNHTGPSCFASLCRTWCFHPRGVVQAPAPANTEPRCVTIPIGMGTGTGDTAGRSRAAPLPHSAPVQGEAPPGMFLSLWPCLDTSFILHL